MLGVLPVKHKLYRRISLVILIIVLLIEAGMLGFNYISLYNETTDNSKNSIEYAAKLASVTFSMYDPNVSRDTQRDLSLGRHGQ